LGKWGPLVNGIAIGWGVIVFFFSFWPSGVPVSAMSMNWSCVLWSAVMVFAVVFWFVHGKNVYKGPVIETDATEADVMRVS
jgi:EamA domain-containing membrane protein RarD